MASEAHELRELLAQTEELRQRFERKQPTSARLLILTKDCARLRAMIAQAEDR